MTTWIRLSDRMGEHPKTLQVPRAHRWALIELLGYCSRNLTDGFVPAEMCTRLIDSDELASLMFAGFVKKHPGGFMIHDYLEWQTPAERVKRRRESGRLGGLKSRPKAAKASAKASSTKVLKHALQIPGEPDTDTDTEKNICSPRIAASEFEKFWNVYPRKVGKARAQKAFTKEIKAASPADIIAGAQSFADDPNLPDTTFIPHPATWLSRAGWLDEPCAPREVKPGDKPTPQPPRFDRAASTNPEAVPPPTNLHDILKGNTA